MTNLQSDKPGPIKVLFIGGAGRSGTTLLEQLLSQCQGFVAVGELRHIWDRSFSQNQLCGCGQPFNECSFWKEVTSDAFGDKLNISQILQLKQNVDRFRYIPMMLFPGMSTAFTKRFVEYTYWIHRLFQGIQNVSGAKVIIDSSKDPSYSYLLHKMPAIDVSFVHLVRDSRAVAYSWQRKKIRPEIFDRKEYMPRHAPVKSAFDWLLYNLSADFFGRMKTEYIRLRYEDLIQDPKQGILNILSSLRVLEDCAPYIFQDSSGKYISHTKSNHTVSGNPIRLQSGRVKLEPDVEWEHAMKSIDRGVVTALTYPLLRAYGYINSQSNRRS